MFLDEDKREVTVKTLKTKYSKARSTVKNLDHAESSRTNKQRMSSCHTIVASFQWLPRSFKMWARFLSFKHIDASGILGILIFMHHLSDPCLQMPHSSFKVLSYLVFKQNKIFELVFLYCLYTSQSHFAPKLIFQPFHLLFVFRF